jgi:hypothetical protein
VSATARSYDLQFRLLDLKPDHRRPALFPVPQPVESPQRDDVRRLRESLNATVAAKVMNATELIRALEKSRREESIPTTLAPLDALLGGGLPRGKMIELVGRRSTGRFAIAMSALAAATSMGEAAVLVDLGDHFDPRLAEEEGVELQRLLWIRPKTLKQAVMSVELIAATGFQLVVLDVGLHPIRGRRVPDAAWVRLARTAEAQGAAMLISTPYPLTGTASEAVVITERSRAKWLGKGNAPRVLAGAATHLRLEKHRHMKAGSQTTLALYVPGWSGRVDESTSRQEKRSSLTPPLDDSSTRPLVHSR